MVGGLDSPDPVSQSHFDKVGVHLCKAVDLGLEVRAFRWFEHASGKKRVGPVSILVDHGEAWAVDRKRGDKFKVAVDTTPVTRQWAAAQLCDPLFGYICDECSRDPYAEAVLTCVDHGHDRACVVVVLNGWDYAERLVRMTRPNGDLADPDGLTPSSED